MNRIFNFALILLPIITGIGCSKDKTTADVIPSQSQKIECQQQAIPNQYVVRWETGEVSLVESGNLDEFIADFVLPQIEKIKTAEPNYSVKVEKNLEKSVGSENWHHTAIQSEYAWDRGITGAGVKVAVIDSGLDMDHEVFAGQLYTNTEEIPGNSIDDDGNGLIDDVNGYDFYLEQGSVSDPGQHGTHVAGIIAGKHLNSSSVRGVAPGAKILPIRFIGPNGDGSLGNAVRAIEYAASRGVNIINASWGSSSCSEILNQAVINLKDKNILFISASGNEATNIDYYPVYPGAVDAENVINVAATSANGPLSYFSNYGFNVHIAAPGTDIYSSLPGNGAGAMSGTSMASPIVAGVAALVKSMLPNASYAEIKDILLRSTSARNLYVQTRGEINVKNVVDEALKSALP